MKLRAGLSLVALAVCAAGVGYFWAAGQRPAAPDALRLAADPSCDLRRAPCRLPLGDGRLLTFGIEPHAIPLLQPLRLSVAVAGEPPPAAISVDIVGLNMEMGLNRTALNRTPAGTWAGETILPVCSRTRMEWEAQVRVRDPGAASERIAPFRFHTQR